MADARTTFDLALGPRFQKFLAELERPIVFFDLESTGTDAVRDRIVEVSLVRLVPPSTVEPPRTWRINPQVRIPREASEVHGITNDDLVNAPTFEQLADELLELLRGCDLAGFAITRFDLRLLAQEFSRAGKVFDTSAIRLVDAQVIFHRREPRDLTAALKFYCDKELTDAHGAQADTLASLEVFAGQLERYADLEGNVAALHDLSAALSSGFVDPNRRFAWKDDEPCFNFGKLKGKSLRWAAGEPSERDYLRWIAQGPFEDEVRAIVQEALAGKIRRRQG